MSKRPRRKQERYKFNLHWEFNKFSRNTHILYYKNDILLEIRPLLHNSHNQQILWVSSCYMNKHNKIKNFGEDVNFNFDRGTYQRITEKRHKPDTYTMYYFEQKVIQKIKECEGTL